MENSTTQKGMITTVAPFLDAPGIIQAHVVFALAGLILGPVALWRKKRDLLHKCVGYAWVLAMTAVAISALFIKSHFSPIGLGPIHLFSIFTLWGLHDAMKAVYRKDIRTHEAVMKNVYVRGLCLAGAFNFCLGARHNAR